MRIGCGYDVHALVSGRKLVLGGLVIPHEKGLQGHSDADVLTHALMDALLGAAGWGDLGRWFPDTDPSFRDICSITMLETIMQHLGAHELAVENADAVIVAQAPRLTPYLHQMTQVLADAMHLSTNRINLKATTTEYLGLTGRGEGMAAHAVVLLREGPDM